MYRLRRLPFFFAHELLVRPSGSAPIYRTRLISGMGRSILPELISNARASSSVFTQLHSGRQVPCVDQ
jgi:hypothetical protein